MVVPEDTTADALLPKRYTGTISQGPMRAAWWRPPDARRTEPTPQCPGLGYGRFELDLRQRKFQHAVHRASVTSGLR